jgi:drug/metabolite transporter (DMT)-like permease
MNPKLLLFTGIILLVIGILIRKMTELEIFGLLLIIIGVTCKSTYIVMKARSGEYKPGKELFILALGLILFFIGLYLRGSEQNLINPTYLIITGITFKIVFIVRFIQISHSIRISSNN